MLTFAQRRLDLLFQQFELIRQPDSCGRIETQPTTAPMVEAQLVPEAPGEKFGVADLVALEGARSCCRLCSKSEERIHEGLTGRRQPKLFAESVASTKVFPF